MTLLQSALLLLTLVWLVAMFQAFSYGKISRLLRRPVPAKATATELPPLSIVITAHDAAPMLRHHLPIIMQQEYDRFEVVVVDKGSSDDTKDVLEHLEQQYANLTHTFTPASAHDISIDRLALTLGIRAASYDWIVITHADCTPLTPGWLTRIGETILQPTQSPQSKKLVSPDLILGLARYEKGRFSWRDAKFNFIRLWDTISHFQHVLSGHAAVQADACNMALRKDFFLSEGGFVLGQGLKVGAEELFVNQTSTAHNTALMLSPASIVMQRRISLSQWKAQRCAYAEIRHHQHHARLYRLKRAFRLLVPWLFLLSLLPVLLLQSLPELILYGFLLMIYAIVKVINFNRTATLLGSTTYHLDFFLFELLLPIWDLQMHISHMTTPKNEFRKKFI